ncbi:CFI-box-CTERM domain-containing protein [Pseudobdellovibrio exovorus]|uniref:Uncharacterized protein n=1 Tax=Pseudobdellovibrio exovorus JSS TaxID=1184267 RepID=M4VMP8_9BACT|nr:CFI-box-CTERM domain-containing protein [Pseudobdellovibrio exovorus]AGH94359.1 hypothetical protein A11Q_139 [Pseudobdellovibrio exovorus JSS]
MAIKCPQCNLDVSDLLPIEPQLRERISELDPEFRLPDEICRSCMSSLRKKAFGPGGILMAQERANSERKGKLWQSRIALVKKGHSLMANNMYSEAAMTYEKYLRLLEIVFDCKTGQLTPEALKEAAKTAELTVIAGVYWDLLRIYDSSEKYTDRQKHSAVQLAKFINYTPVFPDIMKKAEAFLKQAKHPDIVKIFMTNAKKQRARCFIATSAFQTPTAIEVQFLRLYRDQNLKSSFFGRKFIFAYYKTSPTIARFLDRNTWLKPSVRAVLRFVIKCVS